MKKIAKIILLTISFIIVLTLCFEWNKEEIIEENILNIYDEKNKVVLEDKIQKNENSESKIIAKLEIPKINLNTEIFSSSDEENLAIGICKFWGADPNKIGNFCIAGHNYKRKNMFYRLKELKNEDKLYLTDNSGEKIEYLIYKIEKVYPNDTSCLLQDTNGKKEVTLITCTLDSKKRIIIKARENVG